MSGPLVKCSCFISLSRRVNGFTQKQWRALAPWCTVLYKCYDKAPTEDSPGPSVSPYIYTYTVYIHTYMIAGKSCCYLGSSLWGPSESHGLTYKGVHPYDNGLTLDYSYIPFLYEWRAQVYNCLLGA